MEVTIPANFKPRWYQLDYLREIDTGKIKRFYKVWHRRSGKDLTDMAIAAKRMVEVKGLVSYVFPTLTQGRDVLWKGMTREGIRFIDLIPSRFMVGKPNDTRMTIETKNGSIFRVDGADNPDRLRGGNPQTVIFSEWSEHDPYAWDVVRPILAENGGIAIFNLTPKGENHAYEMFQMAEKSDSWWSQVLTVEDTKAISEEVLKTELAEIIEKNGDDAIYQQEYMCSFTTPVQGSYYGAQMKRAEKEGRISGVPYQTESLVNTYWDLGIDDSTTIWFTQNIGREIHLVDYYETSGEGLAYYKKILEEKGYLYGEHWAPHDIQVRELGTGKSRIETARELGINFMVAPKLSIEDGIEAGRNILSRCWFDREKCQRGMTALKSYHKEWDEKNKTYKNHPKHDWSSHGADAFRIMAVSHQQIVETEPQDFSVWEIG